MVNSENKLETVKKKDFIELEYIGKNLTTNEVFDSNILEEAKKINPDVKEVKPLVICIGENMVVSGLDNFLEAKQVGLKYELKLSPESAFGKRDSKLIRLIPLRVFLEQKIYPEKGMTLTLDNSLVRVISVSGGRVMVDFNNPLAGKDIEYIITIRKIVTDIKEKINSIQTYFMGQVFEYDLDEEKRKIIFKDVRLTPVLNVFKDKFKDLVGYDLEVLEKAKKEDKKEEIQEKA